MFWAGAVAALGRSTSELESALRALARRDFVTRENGSRFEGQEQYAFKHALICEVAYRQLRRGARAAKHRLAAEWLETHAQGEDAAELIAHHRWNAFELGGDDPELVRRTLDALVRAGERARGLYAHADAASYLRRALELAELDGADAGPDRRAGLEESLGDVLVIGDPDAGRAAYERALALISPAPGLDRGRLHRKRGATYPLDQPRGAAAALAAFAAAEAALGAPPEPEAPSWWEERIELEFDRIQRLYFTFARRAHSTAVEDARPLVDRHGTPLQKARLLHHLASEQLVRDRFVVEPLTIDRVGRGLATVEATGNLPMISSWRFTLGFVLLFAGRVDEAERCLSSSLELALATGDTTRRVRALCYLALGHRLRADVRRTEETAREALAAALEARMRLYAAQAQAQLAWVAYRERRRAEVRECVDRAWSTWEAAGRSRPPFQWMMLWPALGLAEAAGHHEEALDCARRLLASDCQPPPEPLRERLARAVAAADRGDTASARGLLTEAVELAPAHGML